MNILQFIKKWNFGVEDKSREMKDDLKLILRDQDQFLEKILLSFNPDQITGEWIENNLLEYNIERRQFISYFGIDKSLLSKWIKGKTKPGRLTKLAIFYYFSILKVLKGI